MFETPGLLSCYLPGCNCFMCDLLRQVAIHIIDCPATECDCFVFYPFSGAANRDQRATLKVQLSCYDVCYDIVGRPTIRQKAARLV